MLSIVRLWYSLFGNKFVGAEDTPDKRDRMDEMPRSVSLPEAVDLMARASEEYGRQTGRILTFEKQGPGECTSGAFEIVKAVTNLCLHGEVIEHDMKEHWAHQVKEHGATARYGATLRSALKVGMDYPQGFPFSEYVKIPGNNLQHIKTRLAMGFAIFTGVSWKRTLDGKSNTYAKTVAFGIWEWFKTEILGGHSVAITGYSDYTGMVTITESLKIFWGKATINSTFYVPYSQVGSMMSMYVLRDMREL